MLLGFDVRGQQGWTFLIIMDSIIMDNGVIFSQEATI